MSYYYFEVVVEVKKENASILQTHSNIRALNMYDSLQWYWLNYIGKYYISKNNIVKNFIKPRFTSDYSFINFSIK
jgi:ribosomal protein S18 acetylase RimI-like enzyme